MKNIGLILLVLVLAACGKERNDTRYFLAVSTPDSLGRHDLYEIHIKDTLVTGSIYSNFVRKDTSMIEGVFSESGKIKWIDYDNPKYKGDSFHYGIVNDDGTITQDPDPKYKDYNYFSDYEVLTPVNKKVFDDKKASYFPPVKKTNWIRTVTEGNFIIDIRVDGWDTEDFKGKSTFTIKDKKSGKVLQQINTKDFFCNQYVQFGFTDANFDDMPDLVIPIGMQAADYYLYDAESKTFIYNQDFSSAASGGSEFDEKRKRIIYTNSSGGGCMSIAYLVDGHRVTPWKKAEISYIRYDLYDVEILKWEKDKFILLKRDSVTPKQLRHYKYVDQFLKRYLD
jgi:hypothetical protein